MRHPSARDSGLPRRVYTPHGSASRRRGVDRKSLDFFTNLWSLVKPPRVRQDATSSKLTRVDSARPHPVPMNRVATPGCGNDGRPPRGRAAGSATAPGQKASPFAGKGCGSPSRERPSTGAEEGCRAFHSEARTVPTLAGYAAPHRFATSHELDQLLHLRDIANDQPDHLASLGSLHGHTAYAPRSRTSPAPSRSACPRPRRPPRSAPRPRSLLWRPARLSAPLVRPTFWAPSKACPAPPGAPRSAFGPPGSLEGRPGSPGPQQELAGPRSPGSGQGGCSQY